MIHAGDEGNNHCRKFHNPALFKWFAFMKKETLVKKKQL